MSELDQARAEIQRLRQVIRQAQNALLTGPVHDEDSDSAANVAYSILVHGVHDR